MKRKLKKSNANVATEQRQRVERLQCQCLLESWCERLHLKATRLRRQSSSHRPSWTSWCTLETSALCRGVELPSLPIRPGRFLGERENIEMDTAQSIPVEISVQKKVMKSEWKYINQKVNANVVLWILEEKNTKIDIPVGTVALPLIGRSSPVTPACSSPAEDCQPDSKVWGSYFLLTFNSRASEVIPEHVGSYMRGEHNNSKGITTSTMTHSNRLEPRLMAGLFNG